MIAFLSELWYLFYRITKVVIVMKKKINIDVKQKRQLLKLLNINSVEEIDKTVLKKL